MLYAVMKFNPILFSVMINKRSLLAFFLFKVLVTVQIIQAQSKLSLNTGILYNGSGFTEDVNAIGLMAGLEYMPSEDHVFSIELRTKYVYYNYDDGTKWRTDKEGYPLPPKNPGEARLKYNLFSPQVSLVPRLHLYLNESLSFFLENELVVGLMAGEFRYKGVSKKKKFTDVIYCYNIGLGAEYKFEKWILGGSIAYSTLNFRSKIRDHQPKDYQEGIPDQNAPLLFSVFIKLSL